jgi:hypothetical protein
VTPEDNPADETYYEDHPDNPANKVESVDRYSYSHNEENYYGSYATREEAIAEASADLDKGDRFWTALNSPPTQPEAFWQAEDWLEHVSCQDEYGCDWSMDWESSTAEQRAELEAEVRPVMAAWLERHGLRPRFWSAEEVQMHTVAEVE